MDRIRERLIQDVGRQYARFGHSELLGRVVGVLMCASAPMTEEAIAQELGVSKSPINQITTRLEELNVVRRIRLPGDRKYYYEFPATAFLQAGANLARLYEENLHIADTHLRALLPLFEEATGEEKEALRPVCERLVEMREYWRHIGSMYTRFLAEWRVERTSLPSVEEYARTMEDPVSLLTKV
ncbi:MAG TPA: MarR family transcriptional regulator [Longimicrobiales bacterium]|nr:MarR family transcriptional regulator [Longimicrobiales bacterium]